MKHGAGLLRFANGGFYRGKFYRNEFNDAQATYRWADGSSYVGSYANGVRSGLGALTKADGRKYDGEWANNKRHGQVVCTEPDGG